MPGGQMEEFVPEAEAAGGFDPLGIIRAASDLASTAMTGQELTWLATELTALGQGRSSLWFEGGDHRFDAVTWPASCPLAWRPPTSSGPTRPLSSGLSRRAASRSCAVARTCCAT